MENLDQISDCKCQGNNPNCAICDGKGYFYSSVNKNKSIKNTEADAHILNLDSIGPNNEKEYSYTYRAISKRRTRKDSRNSNIKQEQKAKPINLLEEESVINKSEKVSSNFSQSEIRDNVKRPPRNLVQYFPEIEKFFKNNNFSQANLEKLLDDLKIQYKDKKLYSDALAFVDRELLKIKIEKDKNQQPSRLSKHRKEAKIINSPKKIPDPEIPRNISELSIFLGISNGSLIKYLEQKSIFKKGSDVLDEFEISKITPYILSRLNALKRQKKRRLW